MTAAALEHEAAPTPEAARLDRRGASRRLAYCALPVLAWGAWALGRQGYYEPGDDVGYWLGVTGGSMMLLLLSYPLRKYLRFAHRWGAVRSWFGLHIVLGIGGPLLILLHSGSHLRSVNATVAFISMMVVAGSGIVGRFLYRRVHRGLYGQRCTLQDLQARAGLAQGEMASRFRFAPEVAASLLAFEAQALGNPARRRDLLANLVVLPLRQRLLHRTCVRELRRRLRLMGRQQGWSRRTLRRHQRKAAALTERYLAGVVRVAQFGVYERLFALWHVLHLPCVYLLVLTALFHVFAVHAY